MGEPSQHTPVRDTQPSFAQSWRRTSPSLRFVSVLTIRHLPLTSLCYLSQDFWYRTKSFWWRQPVNLVKLWLRYIEQGTTHQSADGCGIGCYYPFSPPTGTAICKAYATAYNP